MRLTVISAGQPGAERGALQAAIDLGLDHGGWRRASDDDLPAVYAAAMRVSSSSDVGMVRRLCIQDSEGTLAISFGVVPLGVVAFAERLAEQQGRAWLHVSMPAGARDGLSDEVRAEVLDWIREEGIGRLHVTGAGEDDAPGIETTVRREVVKLLEPVAAAELREFQATSMKLLEGMVQAEAELQATPEGQALSTAIDAEVANRLADLIPTKETP